jgi:hypothetical protein
MPTRPFLTSGLIAFALTTSACATSSPGSVSPMLTLPEVAREPCQLPTLPDSPTSADLDATYLARGQAVAICDGRRALAVEAFDAQQRALAPKPRPFWARLLGG